MFSHPRLADELILQILTARAFKAINFTMADAPLTIESRLEIGRRVRVKSGSLMGLEGEIISRRGENRLLIGVQFLQQGASILIRDFQVEPI